VGGGDAGHNGVRSLIAHLGPEFVRVRVGIGRPRPGWDPADYVLSDFTGSEEASLPDVIDRAVEAARMVLAEGPSRAMNRFNRKKKPSRPSEGEAAGGDEESPANREEK
jgi:PTH1 family peptidyl-tRNA hydrolase